MPYFVDLLDKEDTRKYLLLRSQVSTSFRPPKKYFVSFYLLSSPVVLIIALYYLSVQEQQI